MIKILLNFIGRTNILNKWIGTIFGIYLIYLTRDAGLSYDIFMNNVKSNIIYFVILFIILLLIALLFYNNIYKFFFKEEINLKLVLSPFIIILEIVINSLIQSFYNKPNNFGLTQSFTFFNSIFDVQKIYTLDEKKEFLEQILPLIASLSEEKTNQILKSIDWNLITCKNDLYLSIISKLMVEKVQILTEIEIANKNVLFDKLWSLITNNPLIILSAVGVISVFMFYYRESILSYLKESLILFNDFLKEHRAKTLADLKLAENSEILGNQVELLTKLTTNAAKTEVAIISDITNIQQTLVNMQQELLTLSTLVIKNRTELMAEIKLQDEAITKILNFIHSLNNNDSII